LTLSDQHFATDRPGSGSQSDCVRPEFYDRPTVLTQNAHRSFSHERTGREPRMYSTAALSFRANNTVGPSRSSHQIFGLCLTFPQCKIQGCLWPDAKTSVGRRSHVLRLLFQCYSRADSVKIQFVGMDRGQGSGPRRIRQCFLSGVIHIIVVILLFNFILFLTTNIIKSV
jgi:hypothetical protein